MARQVNCAGCRGVITEDSAFMRCAKCKQYFDIICANFSEDTFSTLSSDFKRTWICFECRSALPKYDNSNTPVRQQLSHNKGTGSGCLDVSMHSPDNITIRCGQRSAQPAQPAQIMTKCDNDTPYSMTPVVQGIKKCRMSLKCVSQRKFALY